jgi:hypothetical protein
MKYMLLVYSDEATWSEEDRRECCRESFALANRLHAEGKCLAAAPLESVSVATTVRMRGGKAQVTDGPFAETREQLGGYYVIEAEDLDVAIGIAQQIPAANRAAIEIRPLVELPEFRGSVPVA